MERNPGTCSRISLALHAGYKTGAAMSGARTMSMTEAATRLDQIRQAWRDANVTPLWETTAHKPADSTPRAYHWKWQVLRPLIDRAIEVTTMENAERRVLALTNPDVIGGRNTTTN